MDRLEPDRRRLPLRAGAVALPPPVVNFQATAWTIDEQSISASISGLDIKACHYVRERATGLVYADDQWWTVPLSIAGSRDAPTPKLSWRSFGRWTWGKADGHTPVQRVMATLFVVCAGHPYSIDVGPFDVHG